MKLLVLLRFQPLQKFQVSRHRNSSFLSVRQFRLPHTHIYFDHTVPEEIKLDTSRAAHFKHSILSLTLRITNFNNKTSCIETYTIKF